MNTMVNGTGTKNKKSTMDDKQILDFYNLATGRLLTGLEVSNIIYEANPNLTHTSSKQK